MEDNFHFGIKVNWNYPTLFSKLIVILDIYFVFHFESTFYGWFSSRGAPINLLDFKSKTNPSLNGLTSRFRISVTSDGSIIIRFWFEISSRFVALTQSTQFARNKTVTEALSWSGVCGMGQLDLGWSFSKGRHLV